MTTEIRPSGRTWRDLPAEPPFGDLPPPPEADVQPVPPADPFPPPPRPRRRWAPIVVPLVLFTVLGGGALAWALTRDGGGEPGAAAPTTTAPVPGAELAPPESDFFLPPGPDVPFGADDPLPPDFLDRFGRNFFDEFAPDLEIPEEFLEQMPEDFFEGFGRDFFADPGGGFQLPDDMTELFPPGMTEDLDRLFGELGRNDFFGEGNPFEGLLDDLPPEVRDQIPADLRRQLEELFGGGALDPADPGGAQPFEVPPQFGGNVGLWPTYLPDGYRVSRISVSSSSADVYTQEIQLEGAAGPIVVAVEAGPNRPAPADAPGDPIAAGDGEARERLAFGRRTIVLDRAGATVTITAPDDADRAELIRIAEGLEEAR